jgi:hypothetical protein
MPHAQTRAERLSQVERACFTLDVAIEDVRLLSRSAPALLSALNGSE